MEQEARGFARLMDFARFSGHSRIAAMAAEAEMRNPAAELSDEDLEQLFAAGDLDGMRGSEDKPHDT